MFNKCYIERKDEFPITLHMIKTDLQITLISMLITNRCANKTNNMLIANSPCFFCIHDKN